MATQDFTLFAGDTKTLTVTVKDINDDAVDLTSATIKWQATRSLGKTSALSKTTSSGISITDAAGGEFQISIDAGDTDDLSGNYTHEAEVTFADSTVATVLQGTMKVRPVVIEAT